LPTGNVVFHDGEKPKNGAEELKEAERWAGETAAKDVGARDDQGAGN
jgi:hypothetical protein